MGSEMCIRDSSYANIFLCAWEDIIFSHCRPPLWLRYIDDVFFLWNCSPSDLFSFRDFVNAVYSTIKVDLSFELFCIRFLDLSLKKSGSHLSYCIGFKPTDTHGILSPWSFHPRHVFRAIIFGEVYRWATHSATYDDFCTTKSTVQPRWLQQGHSRHAIRTAVRRVLRLTGQTPTAWDTGFFPCTDGCSVCPFSIFTRQVYNTFTNVSFIIVHRLFCHSVNIIYLIRCKQCSKSYVGQTSRSLRRRMEQHLADITARRPTPLAEHFNGSCTASDFSFTALEHCPNLEKRLKKENVWMGRLQSLKPDGLNTQLNTNEALHLVVPFSQCGQLIARRATRHLSDVRTRISFTRHRNLRSILTTRLRQTRTSATQ